MDGLIDLAHTTLANPIRDDVWPECEFSTAGFQLMHLIGGQ